MPNVDIAEHQILDSLDQLSPKARREAIRRLLPSAAWLERAVERHHPRVEVLARQRGRDWSGMNDEEREQFIDELLHE